MTIGTRALLVTRFSHFGPKGIPCWFPRCPPVGEISMVLGEMIFSVNVVKTMPETSHFGMVHKNGK